MLNLISPEKLHLVSQGDLPTLIELDSHGLLLGPDESIDAYLRRLTQLQQNLAEFERTIAEAGRLEIFAMNLTSADLIPPAVFAAAQQRTSALYDFAIDWVPGFFTNERMGWLFAGCALYDHDDFSALFLVRKSFQFREKWLIYSRVELIAHELCHIAHVGFRVKNYEEIFAYQTAESWFRRVCGGLLRTTANTYLLLGAGFTMLIAQFLNLGLRPPWQWRAQPMPSIFTLCLGVFVYVIARYLFYWQRFRKARRTMSQGVDPRVAAAVLFRCSEAEIKTVAQLQNSARLTAWLKRQADRSLRWKIIQQKYFHHPPG